MLPYFKNELKRAIFSKSSLVAFILTLITLLIGAYGTLFYGFSPQFDYCKKLYDSIDIFIITKDFGPYSFLGVIAPLLAVLPFSNSYLQEKDPGFLPQYSAFKNLKILSSIHNKIDDETIKKYINLVTLDADDNRPVKKFSLGMKQKLGIAQALMEEPKLLILDEPMNALDEDSVINIRKILLDLKSKGVTILLSSHNKEDIEQLCDYIYTMKSGELII